MRSEGQRRKCQGKGNTVTYQDAKEATHVAGDEGDAGGGKGRVTDGNVFLAKGERARTRKGRPRQEKGRKRRKDGGKEVRIKWRKRRDARQDGGNLTWQEGRK